MNDCNNLSNNQIPGNIWTEIRSSHLDFPPKQKKHCMQPPCGGEFVMMMMMQGDDLAQVHQQEEEEDPNTILEIPYPFSTLS